MRDAPALPGTAGEATYRAIRLDIITGRLAPRLRLRLEGLRERYGASVSTLRETLNRLATEGLVTAEGQRGFQVAPITAGELRELAAMRELLEGHAMAKSFVRGDLEWEGRVVGAHHKLARLEQRMSAGETGCTELWKHYDREFHHVLISACESDELLQAHAGIFDRYLRYLIIAVVFRGAPAATEHAEMLAAALDRDTARAQAALHSHIWGCVEQTLASGALGTGEGKAA